MTAPRRAACEPERLAARDPDLLPDEVDSGRQLGDGMLDLQAAVHLDEVRLSVRAEQELERAGVLVADVLAGPLHRGLHRLACLGRQRW